MEEGRPSGPVGESSAWERGRLGDDRELRGSGVLSGFSRVDLTQAKGFTQVCLRPRIGGDEQGEQRENDDTADHVLFLGVT